MPAIYRCYQLDLKWDNKPAPKDEQYVKCHKCMVQRH